MLVLLFKLMLDLTELTLLFSIVALQLIIPKLQLKEFLRFFVEAEF